MTTIEALVSVLVRVFMPVSVLLAALGLVLVDLPAGFTAAVAALVAFAVCLVAAPTMSAGRPLRRTRLAAR